jgi:hypothetical protein
MTPAPKRRWFRYSLRTLFVVVTAVCCWLGWQAKMVNDRRAMRNDIEESGGKFPSFLSGNIEPIQEGDQSFALSSIRRWLGDEELPAIYFPRRPASAIDIARARYFPEATAFINGPEPYSE